MNALQGGYACNRDIIEPYMNPESVTLDVDGAEPVAGLLMRPPGAVACYVFAPGAGAGIEHSFMTACADELASLGIATLRYQFPYMQRGSRRPDPPETVTRPCALR
jgi:hypothetical protein